MNLDNKKGRSILILGAGESGVGAALLAKKLGFSVFVSDMAPIKEAYKKELEAIQVPFEENGHNTDYCLGFAGLVIKSPGIPDKAPLIKALKAAGKTVIDELEFASRYTDAKLIAITGSNGKTTTTLLTYHLLKAAGLKVGLAGNVGFSLAKQVAESDMDYYVVEISSFQLDGIDSFRPDVAMITNITPDHLDRYDYKLENYIASKFRIFKNKELSDLAFYNSDDENIKYGFEHFYTRELPINGLGISMNLLAETSMEENLNIQHSNISIPKKDLTLKGRHNYFNITCAVLAAKRYGIADTTIVEALKTFKNEAHRLEAVVTIQGVEYINDSKATNVDSVFYALDAMTKPVVWIVGGVDKGNDYSPIMDLVKEKVRAIVCLGTDNSKVLAAFGAVKELILETNSMQEAIKVSSLYAESGDAVLLSPACASFDLFENYIHRGNLFKEVLLEQYKILAGQGVEMELHVNLNLNPAEHKTDNENKSKQ